MSEAEIKKMNIPKLRFREFSNTLTKTKLKNLNITISDGNYGEKYPRAAEITDHGVPFIRANNIKESILVWEDMKYISPELHSTLKSGHLDTGDVLITTRGDIGTVAYVTEDFAGSNINAQICLLRTGEEISSQFLFQYLNTGIGKAQFRELQTGSALKQLPKGKLGLVETSLPGLSEQNKIADFLTVVDEKISKLEQERKHFEKYKQGAMQAIFSQEIRFKATDGANYPNWEEKRLGELGSFKTSGIDKLFYFDQKEVYLVNYMNVYRHEELSLNTSKYLSKTSVNSRQEVEASLKKGDILFTPSSETPNDIGHSVVIREDLPNTVFSYHLMRFRPTVDISIGFSNYFCNTKSVLKQISQRCQGSTRFTITVGEFSKVKVFLPKSPEEQDRIADFLTKIENKIDLLNKKLDQAREFKKGLLQEMFV